jgi:hypothetical protein
MITENAKMTMLHLKNYILGMMLDLSLSGDFDPSTAVALKNAAIDLQSYIFHDNHFSEVCDIMFAMASQLRAMAKNRCVFCRIHSKQ